MSGGVRNASRSGASCGPSSDSSPAPCSTKAARIMLSVVIVLYLMMTNRLYYTIICYTIL